MKHAQVITPAVVERPVIITFENDERMEFTPRQYAQIVAYVMADMCRGCLGKRPRAKEKS